MLNSVKVILSEVLLHLSDKTYFIVFWDWNFFIIKDIKGANRGKCLRCNEFIGKARCDYCDCVASNKNLKWAGPQNLCIY